MRDVVDLVLLSSALIYSSLIALLSIGLTLTYQTTKVPNFAHGTFAAVGTYVTLTAVRVFNEGVYKFIFLAFIIGAVIAVTQYLLVFRPLMRKGASVVEIMITTLAMEFILLALINIYADFLSNVLKIDSRYFLFASLDTRIFGIRALLIIAPTLVLLTVTSLYLVLTRTKFGIGMRAAIEDSSLASIMGINVNLVYAISWFISGGLGGLSGALLPLWFPGNPDIGGRLIVSIFASSIIGGLFNIYGAVLGGFLIGLAELLGTSYLASLFGSWVIPYRPLIPVIAIMITLLLAPEGLTGVNWREIFVLISNFIRSKTKR